MAQNNEENMSNNQDYKNQQLKTTRISQSEIQNEENLFTQNAKVLAKLTAEQLDNRRSIPYKLPTFIRAIHEIGLCLSTHSRHPLMS